MSPEPENRARRGHAGHAAHDPERAARHRRDQAVFHELLRRHDAIARSVEEVEGGIRARTTSADPRLAGLIRAHAHEMHRRLGEGFGLRHWDPAFAELFAQRDKVRLVVTDRPDGVEIVETSEDANVVLLIRAHGATVSAFVREGGRAAGQESALPAAYRRVLA